MEKNKSDAKMEEKKNKSIKNEKSFNLKKDVKDANFIINEKQKEIIRKDEKKNKNIIVGENSINDELNEKYMNIINNNPESLFEIITPSIISLWENNLFKFSFDMIIITSDNQIITTVPDRLDQSVIRIDAKRTRYREKKLIVGFEKILELILTFYCNKKQIAYKQGLNEIFGILLLMKYKIKNLKLLNIVNLGEAFINKFFQNYYFEKEVSFLKLGIHFFSILLKYHEPNIYHYLDKYEIPHELYAANWILTFRSNKLQIDNFYYLLDNLIKINDPLFINFILVALIKSKREILFSSDGKRLLKILSNLTFNSKEEIDYIIKIALELRNLTPYSYRFWSNDIGLYNGEKLNDIDNIELGGPIFSPTMPMYPVEILFKNYSYTNKILCPDKDCPNNKRNNIVTIDWGNEKIYKSDKKLNYICEKCTFKIEKKFNYIIVDLRLYEPSKFKNRDEFYKMGVISKSLEINKEDLLSGDIDKLISNRLLSIRGDHHIILMTSRTDYFKQLEEKFYSDKTTEEERAKKILGLIDEGKTEKVLNIKDFENNLDYDELYKLKEYDNFRKLLIAMKDKNFPYVSYLEGGFEALHQECLNYKIELVDHDSEACKLCLNKNTKIKNGKISKKPLVKKISETFWKNKYISMNELNNYLANEENIILICCLRKFINKHYIGDECEVFILFIFDNKSIQIYTKEKQLGNKNSNYYNLGVNTQNKKEIVLRHFYSISFNEIKGIKSYKNDRNIIELELNSKEKDNESNNNMNNIEIEFEFHSKEDTKTFKSLIKKIKNL